MIRRTILRQTRLLASSHSLSTQIYIPPLKSRSCPHPLTFAPSLRLKAASRSYSTEPPSKDDASAFATTETVDEARVKLEEDLLVKKDREITNWKDRYMRGVADFRNLQDQTKRDMQAARDFAIQKFAKDLIESVDNLDRALSTVPEEKLDEKEEAQKDLLALYGGLKMTESILLSTLKKHGLERFDPSVEGEKFDPNLHEATFMSPVEDRQDGTVFTTQQKGFKLNGRVLRAAKVGVVKNPASS